MKSDYTFCKHANDFRKNRMSALDEHEQFSCSITVFKPADKFGIHMLNVCIVRRQ